MGDSHDTKAKTAVTARAGVPAQHTAHGRAKKSQALPSALAISCVPWIMIDFGSIRSGGFAGLFNWGLNDDAVGLY